MGSLKKAEPLWDLIIRSRRVAGCLPLLEAVLDGREAGVAGAALRAPPATGSGSDHFQVTYRLAENPVSALPETPGMYARTL